MKEVTFVARLDEDGYTARAVGQNIFTQGDTEEDLHAMIRDAVLCHFGEGHGPERVVVRLGEQTTRLPTHAKDA